VSGQGTIYLSTGSNLGNREQNLASALAALSDFLTVTAVSSLYETEPWGYADQPAFLNQVIAGTTPLDPPSIHALIKRIETGQGRTPTFRYGPRLIDIDILAIGRLVLETPELVLPHPRLQERAFVLVPLAEIAPGWVHPVLHLDAKSLLEKVDASGVKLYPSTGTVPDHR
jgi:2-amino-4-hydroxy-6-hydroxymethyldihydropteridine diphosphokinase